MGVILTGMGEDGANGLEAISAAGGIVLAQDEESSVIYGMPRAAAERGLALEVLPLEQIPDRIVHWLHRGLPRGGDADG
jgi:chemotaxis response regulator CheB